VTPRLVVTCGDVNGIGLECLIKAVAQAPFTAQLMLAVDRATLADYVDVMGLSARVDDEGLHTSGLSIPILDLERPTPVEPGRTRAASGGLAVAALERAADAVLAGEADGVVTLPISKEACHLAGFGYPGQTEFFGARWGGVPIMILAWNRVRVALATVHVSLRSVPGLLSIDHLTERIATLDLTLRMDFGIRSPRIAVLGLNPHAGENGTIGRSELDVIGPAIEQANARLTGSTVAGPFPADGFFGFGTFEAYDGILAMYHDQGLIPLKLLAHGGGVNVSAGLRFVRTSPDHGTAFGLAGTGSADPTSTIEAIETAIAIVERRARPAGSVRPG